MILKSQFCLPRWHMYSRPSTHPPTHPHGYFKISWRTNTRPTCSWVFNVDFWCPWTSAYVATFLECEHKSSIADDNFSGVKSLEDTTFLHEKENPNSNTMNVRYTLITNLRSCRFLTYLGHSVRCKNQQTATNKLCTRASLTLCVNLFAFVLATPALPVKPV